MTDPVIIRFALGKATPTLNAMLRRNKFKRGKPRQDLAWEIKLAILAIPGQSLPTKPFTTAQITVIRKSTGDPDPDGLTGSFKDILDILQPMSTRHPCGLGIIVNDNAACLGNGVVVTAERVTKQNEQGTWVLIEGFADV